MKRGPALRGRRLSLRLLESHVRIQSDDPALLEQLGRCFEESCADHSDGSPDLVVRLESPAAGSQPPGIAVATQPVGELEGLRSPLPCDASALCRALVQWAVERAANHLVFHAAAVARNGTAILLPGPSCSGKSTLAVALGRRGFALLSDEVGAVDTDSGRLVGFPRGVSLRRDVLSELGLPASIGIALAGDGARMARARDLGLGRQVAARLSMIVVPRFERRATTRIERLSPAAAALALWETACSQPRLRVVRLDFILDLVRRLPCHRLLFSDLEEAADGIEAALREASPSAQAAAPLPRRGMPGTGTPSPVPGRPLVRDDLVVRQVDDEFFLYQPALDRVVLLNLSAAAVFDLCDGTRTTEQIAAEVARAYGADVSQVGEDVRNTLAQFSSSGLLIEGTNPPSSKSRPTALE